MEGEKGRWLRKIEEEGESEKDGGRKKVHFCTYVPGDGAINIRHYDLVGVVPEIQCALRLSGTLHRLPEWYGEHI